MLKKITLGLFLTLTLLSATEITIHVECNQKPYIYCIDNQPTGLVIDILESIFKKFEHYTLDLKPITDTSIHVNIMATIQKEKFTKYRIADYSNPILEAESSKSVDKDYYIGFTSTSFPEKKDFIKKINLAVQIMKDNNQIERLIKNSFKKYSQESVHKKVIVGVYKWGEKMLNKRIEGYGLIPAIITASFKEENIDVEYQFFDYPYTYLLTKWGKICVSGSWLDRGDRKKYMYYSDNIFTTKVYLYYNKNYFKKGIVFSDYIDLAKYKVGGVAGMYYEEEEYFQDNKLIRYTSYSTLSEAIKGLLKNEVEIIIAEKNRLNKRVKDKFSHQVENIIFHTIPFATQGNYVLFSKRCESSEFLKKQFDSGYQTIKKNGKLNKIFLKYSEEEEDN